MEPNSLLGTAGPQIEITTDDGRVITGTIVPGTWTEEAADGSSVEYRLDLHPEKVTYPDGHVVHFHDFDPETLGLLYGNVDGGQLP